MKFSHSAAMIAVLSGVASAQAFTGSFPLVTPNGNPTGIECNEFGDLLFTDVGPAARLGLTSTSGSITLTFDISANSANPIGITQDGSMIYITDAAGSDVDIYDGGGNFVSSFSIAATVGSPEGITYSSATGNLYITDGNTAQVREYSTAGALLGTFSLNGSSVDGIAHDETDDTFWVYDSGTDSLRHYDNGFTELSSTPGTVSNGLSTGEGVAVIGSDIYVCATGSDEIAVFTTVGTTGQAIAYGDGCPQPNDGFYEQFPNNGNDLSGFSFTVTPTAQGFSVTNAGSFDPGFSNNLSSGDDTLFSGQALGFTATFAGLGTISAIDIDSNGRIGAGLSGSDFTESVNQFLGQTMVAVCWDDFNPGASGDLFFDTAPTFAMVTWNQVPQFGDSDSNTFQVKLHNDGRIECNYVTVSDDSIVGLSAGTATNDPGSMDLTATIPFSRSGGIPLTLTATSRPQTGQTFDMLTSFIPGSATSGGTILGVSQTNVTLPVLPSDCTILSSGDLTTLPLNLGTGASSISLPNSAALIGVSIFAQSVVIDPAQTATVPAIFSNGLRIDVGNL